MSRKTGIITFHRTTNFGSLLQTYGLYRKICDLGVSCEIIDYRCPAIEKRENLNKPLLSTNLKQFVRNVLYQPNYKRKAKTLSDFSTNNMKISSTYTPNNILLANDIYDRFIVGSDIVWNREITNSDYAYFLNFVNDDKEMYAFSASVGDYFTKGDEEYITRLLNRFLQIAVREDDAVRWLSSLGIADSKCVCDPTMLLTPSEWTKYITPKNYKNDYVLIYFNDDKCKNIRDAIEFAKANQLKVKLINYDRPYSGVQNIKPFSLEEFLGLIINAKMIFTASYHGLLFSLYFNKEFMFYTRAHSSRILSLAKRLNIENQCGDNMKINEYKGIDYHQLNEKINDFRDRSIDILKKMLV